MCPKGDCFRLPALSIYYLHQHHYLVAVCRWCQIHKDSPAPPLRGCQGWSLQAGVPPPGQAVRASAADPTHKGSRLLALLPHRAGRGKRPCTQGQLAKGSLLLCRFHRHPGRREGCARVSDADSRLSPTSTTNCRAGLPAQAFPYVSRYQLSPR